MEEFPDISEYVQKKTDKLGIKTHTKPVKINKLCYNGLISLRFIFTFITITAAPSAFCMFLVFAKKASTHTL